MRTVLGHRSLALPLALISRSFGSKSPKPVDPSTLPKANHLYIKEIHEPKYLELLKPRIPFYDFVNIQVKGYDYVVLEEYVKFIQKTAKHLKLNMHDFWGVPAVSMKQDNYQPASQLISSTETVKIHERTVQLKQITCKDCSILIEAVQAGKPPLVSLKVSQHDSDDEEWRYIPDMMLKGFEQELVELQDQPVSVLTTAKTTKKK